MLSQLIDTTIFITIAFYGTVPHSVLVTLIVTLGSSRRSWYRKGLSKNRKPGKDESPKGGSDCRESLDFLKNIYIQ